MTDPRFVIRMAVRSLRAAPMISLLAILCIGLGIGSVTTVYSTASAFTLHPLPQLVAPERLLFVADASANAPTRSSTVAAGTFADLRSLREFSVSAAIDNFTANIVGDDLPERATGARVSADFFRLTGRVALLGRVFRAEEMQPGADRVAVLSHGLWQRRFGGDSAIIGRVVRINGEPWEIVGVMPDDFMFPAGTQIWAPLALPPALAADRENRNLFMMARLAPGVSAAQAAAALSVAGDRLRSAWPKVYENRILYSRLAESVFGDGPRPFMMVLIAAVVFQLLIACANVANLLLARATRERRKTGVQIALGASRGGLAAQHLAESALLGVAGGALGVVMAWWGVRATVAAVPVEVQQYIPGFGAIHLDARALVVATVISVVSGLLFGIVPAIASSLVDVVTSLKDAGRSESRRSLVRRLRSGLVVGEIALAVMLVAGAALMVSTFRRISVSDPGFRTRQVLTATVTLPDADYVTDSSVVLFWRRLRQATAALPGVEAAELTTVLPMTWVDDRARFYPEHQKPEHLDDIPSAGLRRVSAGYLRALDMTLVSGRWFAESDAQTAPAVAIVSERAARRFFPQRDAIGRRLVARDQTFEVVGVVRDVRGNPLTSDAPLDVVYVPLEQWISQTASIVIPSGQDPSALAPTLQHTIGQLDARLAAGDVAPMTRVVATVTSPQAATSQTLLAAAVIALVMAAVGTFGVMSYVVGRRTHEMGLRQALGATQRDIVRLVVGGVARLALPGVALGVLGALALGQGMRAILFNTSASDPIALIGAAVLLALVSLAAGFIPALRAARISPFVALRIDR